jgi:hypothetical protein
LSFPYRFYFRENDTQRAAFRPVEVAMAKAFRIVSEFISQPAAPSRVTATLRCAAGPLGAAIHFIPLQVFNDDDEEDTEAAGPAKDDMHDLDGMRTWGFLRGAQRVPNAAEWPWHAAYPFPAAFGATCTALPFEFT